MTTIRRIYVFVVCFISLQSVAVSIKLLLDALLNWLVTQQTSDLRSVVFPLAVVIAGTPMFLGHWLWADWSARRDPAERRCLERHLYLSVTLALLTAYLAFAIYATVQALLQLLLPASLRQIEAHSTPLPAFISSLLTVIVLSLVWGYHRLTSAQDEKAEPQPSAERPAPLEFFSNLGFAGLGMALMTFGVFMILYDLLRLPEEHTLLFFSTAAGAWVAGSVLWAYHQWGLVRDPSARADFKVATRWLYAQSFSFVGWTLVVGGLVGVQTWFFAWLSGSAQTTLPTLTAALITGLPLFIYHEWNLDRASADGLKLWRQLYVAGINLTALMMAIVGAINSLDWALGFIAGRNAVIPDAAAWLLPGLFTWAYYEFEMYRVDKSVRWWQALGLSLLGALLISIGAMYLQEWMMGAMSAGGMTLTAALSWLFTGLPVCLYYEWLVYRHQRHGQATARWFTAWAVQNCGVWMTTIGLIQSLHWLFDLLAGERPMAPFGASWLGAGVLLWIYYRQVSARSGGEEPLFTRLSVFGFSGLGISLTTLGLIGVQEWIFARFVGKPVLNLPDTLAALIAGLPLWLYFWRWASRLFASGQPEEQKSDLRKIYLYLIIYIAVHSAVITLGLLMNGLLRQLLGLPTTGSLGLPLSIIIASVALWAYHAFVLHQDIRRVGETSLQGGMQRLYWYLVAGIGLLAFVLGLAGTLSSVLRLIAALSEGAAFTVALREQLAAALASLLAGLPVWASAWFPAQRAARLPRKVEMRRSLLRKAYLYFYLLLATLVVLIFSVTIVFQLLNALFGLFHGGNLLADLGQSIGFAVMGVALWVYHSWALRGDQRFARQENEQIAQQTADKHQEALQKLKARWASFRVVVVDPGDGRFGQAVINELGREWPQLNVVGVGLTPQARGVLQPADAVPATDPEASPPPTEGTLLRDASLIIAPWTAAAPSSLIAQSKAIKLIVPIPVEGMHWVGVPALAATASSLIQAVRQILQAQISTSPKAVPTVA